MDTGEFCGTGYIYRGFRNQQPYRKETDLYETKICIDACADSNLGLRHRYKYISVSSIMVATPNTAQSHRLLQEVNRRLKTKSFRHSDLY